MAKMIKHSLIAGAALASLAGAVQAQSVTLYGRIDVGVEYNSKTGNNQDGRVHLRDGGIRPSIWGLKGSEDLGGGLKAVFNLESDFGGDNGADRFRDTFGIQASLVPFGRQANVGLSGGFGTVLLGRQYSPALLAEFGVEPRAFKESYSGLMPYALAQLPDGNGLGPNNWGGIFTGNMISYSGSFGPVNVGAGYGFGENLGGSNARTYSLGVSYTGPVTVGASYQQIEGAGNDAETQRYAIGVAVPFGAITAKLHYANASQDNAAGVEVQETDTISAGLDFAWNPQNTATLAYYHVKGDRGSEGKSKSLVLSNDYALSKRTTLYAQLVYIDKDSDAPFDISIFDAVAGEKTTIFGVGVSHNF